MKKDLYQEITDRMIEELENGIIPWRKPWTGVTTGAISHTTGRPYSLINQYLLRKPGEYLTFNQAKEEGGRIKKGAKAQFIVFWKISRRQALNDDGTPATDADGSPIIKGYPILKYYNVFHIEDCEGIEPKYSDGELPKSAEPDAEAERIFNEYIAREKITFRNVRGNKACYSPILDAIELPLMDQFAETSEYYSTLFHEATHSTGHKSRLNRFKAGAAAAAFGGEEYSKEELTAEIGSACILHEIGMETPETFKNSAAYIQSWLQALKNDKRMIVGAAARADKAAKMILNIQSETETE